MAPSVQAIEGVQLTEIVNWVIKLDLAEKALLYITDYV